MKKQSSYLDELTILRGLAALWVFFSHAVRILESGHSSPDFQSFFSGDLFYLRLLDLGQFAVYVFFALSGFTLYWVSGVGKNFDFFDFSIKRFFRVWPVFLVSLFVYHCMSVLLFLQYDFGNQYLLEEFRVPSDWSLLWPYLTFTQNFFGGGYYIGPYWSLPIEFQYYILLGLILLTFAGVKQRILVFVFLVVLFYIGFAVLRGFGVPFDLRLFSMAGSFFGGAALACLFSLGKNKSQSGRFHLIAQYVTLPIVSILAFLIFYSDIQGRYLNLLYIILALALVWASVEFRVYNIFPPFFRSVLLDVGKYSYSVYLYHMLFFAVVYMIFSHSGLGLGSIYGFLYVLISLLITVVFSKYVFYKVELYFIALGKRVIQL